MIALTAFAFGYIKVVFFALLTIFLYRFGTLAKDFKVLKDYDKEERIDSTHYLLIAGLSQLRSLEAYWELRQLINSDVNVKIANYTLESTQGKRGFVIRIYD